jgi:hypothetical protein
MSLPKEREKRMTLENGKKDRDKRRLRRNNSTKRHLTTKERSWK